MSADIPMGQFFMLRRTNIDKAIKMTGYSREDCETILARSEEYGNDKVKVPLLPLEVREQLARESEQEATDGSVSTQANTGEDHI